MLAKIKGKIVKGHGEGRKLGFPTFNVAYNGEIKGVFVGKMLFPDGSEYKAAISIGGRPTFNDENQSCEAHLIDFEGNENYWGTEVEVQLYQEIRGLRKFANVEELSEQLHKDVGLVRNFDL